MNLLLIPCGQKKRKLKFRAPALELYDGPTYKVLRRYYNPDKLFVLILSAKYGLLSPYQFVEYYDQKMDLKRALELRPYTSTFIQDYAATRQISTVFVALSKLYLDAIDLSNLPCCRYEKRGLGFKLSFVKKVLTGEIK